MNALTRRGGLFDEFFRDFAPGYFIQPLHGDPLPAQIKLDVQERDGAFDVQAEIPGVRKEDIRVEIDGNVLSLQAEVRQELGPPKAIRKAEGGETIWVYELMEQQSGNRFTAPGVWCEQYLVTFDDKAIFQRWKQVTHFHGGELMPTECIPGTDQSKSSSNASQ